MRLQVAGFGTSFHWQVQGQHLLYKTIDYQTLIAVVPAVVQNNN
jgi:hypothetical protein